MRTSKWGKLSFIDRTPIACSASISEPLGDDVDGVQRRIRLPQIKLRSSPLIFPSSNSTPKDLDKHAQIKCRDSCLRRHGLGGEQHRSAVASSESRAESRGVDCWLCMFLDLIPSSIYRIRNSNVGIGCNSHHLLRHMCNRRLCFPNIVLRHGGSVIYPVDVHL